MNELKEKYYNEIKKALKEKFGYKNELEAPKLEKIVINMGVGEGAHDHKLIDAAAKDLSLISGQKPIITKAKKSVANFKLREGASIGCKVTLRGDNMYNFLYKLINIVLPDTMDFNGLNPRSFDGRGNYTLGLNEQLVFKEINYDDVVKTRGMDIVIVTTAKNDEEAKELLKLLGLPFRK